MFNYHLLQRERERERERERGTQRREERKRRARTTEGEEVVLSDAGDEEVDVKELARIE